MVVLPAPFGPSTATHSPVSTDRSMPRTASTDPYDLRSPRTSIAVVIAPCPPRRRSVYPIEPGPPKGSSISGRPGDPKGSANGSAKGSITPSTSASSAPYPA